MARITERERRWWAAQPEQQTCSRCSRVGTKAYVQPQYPPHDKHGAALCTDCIMAINREIDARRKAQLDAMPRCEVPGCRRRGMAWWGWRGGERVLLCGRCGKWAQRAYVARYAGGPFFWLPGPALSKAQIIELAQATQAVQVKESGHASTLAR